LQGAFLAIGFRGHFRHVARITPVEISFGADAAFLVKKDFREVRFAELDLDLEIPGVGHGNYGGARPARPAETLRCDQFARVDEFLHDHPVDGRANHRPFKIGLREIDGALSFLERGARGLQF